ncbi:major facilitator superfamily domain-containing protein [Myxozyma melibiosi]|uniref:Major facilitator superfamily domain-containing protein n=1 Tax=Myxozyma melibiosi TaxID=54550 RepID=A0ABR1FC29_9ASCO
MSEFVAVQEVIDEDLAFMAAQDVLSSQARPSHGSPVSNKQPNVTVTSARYMDYPERGEQEQWRSTHESRSSNRLSFSFWRPSRTVFKTPSVFFLLPAFLLLTVAHGALMAPKLNLLLTLICRADFPEYNINPHADVDPQCQTPYVHARVSNFNLTVNLIQGILAAVMSPKLGALSDRIGRCAVLAICSLGPLVSVLVLIFMLDSSYEYVYRWYWLAAILDGITGSASAMMAAAFAYTTDSTPADKRASAFGLCHACFSLGLALGPAFGSFLIKSTDSILVVFYAVILAQLLFIGYALFVLPESVSIEHRLDAQQVFNDGRELNSDTGLMPRNLAELLDRLNFLKPLRILWPSSSVAPQIRRNISFLAGIDTILIGAGAGAMMIKLLYAELIFHWSSVEAGYFISIMGVTRAFVLVIVLPLVSRYTVRMFNHGRVSHVGASQSDVFLIRCGVFVEVLAYALYLISRSSTQFMLSGCIGSVGTIASPTIQSTLTKHVPKRKTGELLGAMALLHSLCSIIAPTIFAFVYVNTVGWFPAAFLLMTIVIFGFAFFLSLMLRKNTHDNLYAGVAGEEEVDGAVELEDDQPLHAH